MRVDKYLKVSRLVKRRTVAKELADAGRVELNGRTAKAGSELLVGDRLKILRYGGRNREIEVLALAESIRADEAASLYRLISEERLMQEDDFFNLPL